MDNFLKKFLALTVIFACAISAGVYYVKLAGAQTQTWSVAFQPNPASNIAATTASLNGELAGTVSGNVSVWFEYYASYGQSSPNYKQSAIQNRSATGQYSIQLTGLYPEMRYCATAVAEDTLGRLENPVEKCFTTNAPSGDGDIQARLVPLTLQASNISSNSATFNGRIEGLKSTETGYFWFEYKGADGVIKSTNGRITRNGRGSYSQIASGLEPSTRYTFRAVGEKNGTTEYGDWELFYTIAGNMGNQYYYCANENQQCSLTAQNYQSVSACNDWLKNYYGPSTSKVCYEQGQKNSCDSACQTQQTGRKYYYCYKDLQKCYQTGVEYQDSGTCISDLKSFHGSNILDSCYQYESDCNNACGGSSSSKKSYYYCPQRGSYCSLTSQQYSSISDCDVDVPNGRCYDSNQRNTCDSECLSGGQTDQRRQYFYCNKSLSTCQKTASSYLSASECANDLSAFFGSQILPQCYSYSSDCMSACAATKPPVQRQKYYYCLTASASCNATGAEYANSGECYNDLYKFFGDKIKPACYANISDCQTACATYIPPVTTRKYYYCNQTNGICKQTNGKYSSLATCRDAVNAVYGNTATGQCYEDDGTCSAVCHQIQPTKKKYYYCNKDINKCILTDTEYIADSSGKQECQDDLSTQFPGKTDGKCYSSSTECSSQCVAGGSDVDPNNLPAHFDWRDYKSKNWMTSVKDQGQCGGCWAFAAVAATEAKYNIEQKNSGLALNLSEQDLISCSDAGGCDGTTFLPSGLEALMDNGAVEEPCFPFISYNGSNVRCNRCSSWQSKLWKIKSYDGRSMSDEAVKKALVQYGPLVTSMFAGDDYYSPNFNLPITRCDQSRINPRVLHAITLVGYDDASGYWIIKNSWGPYWNGEGYFKLGYGECMINALGVYYPIGVTPPK